MNRQAWLRQGLRRALGRQRAAWAMGLGSLLLAAVMAAVQGAAPEPEPKPPGAAAAAPGEVLQGRVQRWIDGDSLVLQVDTQLVEVRLHGIDAPEGRQPGGNASRDALRALCQDQTVRLLVRDVDSYRRTVGVLHCGSRNANLNQVASGHAWVYGRHADPGDPMFAAEAQARAERRGLWADPGAQPPWDWRRERARPPR